MISRVQILPAIYHLQRQSVVGGIDICALNSQPLRALAEDRTLKEAFPGQEFAAHPPLTTEPDKNFPEIYKQVMAEMAPHNIVVVAVPDQLHHEVIQTALQDEQHICCVKPLVLQHDQAQKIAEEAYEKGLFVGVEYHKRFDYRSLMARRRYRAGQLGEFRLGQASLHECWYYRHSNFQNWCTCENSDMFSYVACHYIDLVHFITGLLPAAVSVYGIVDEYPKGTQGYLWTDGRVVWQNGACLNVQNSLGYPDDGPGGNFQGMRLYCSGTDGGAMIVHNDQFRGIEHAYLERPDHPGGTIYSEPNPDYFQYVDTGGPGLEPTGYGYRSIEQIIRHICRCNEQAAGLNEKGALAQRQEFIKETDRQGIIATPCNSVYNELVMAAGRLSILNGGREVEIAYEPEAQVRFRKY